MGYLIGAIIVIAIVISLVTYITFFIWMLAIWYLGRQLWRQYLRYRAWQNLHQLLLSIGLCSLLIVSVLKVALVLKILIAASLFTLCSIIATEVWAFRNKKVPFSRLQLLQDRERSLNRQIKEREKQIASTQGEITMIEERFREIIEHKRALEEKVSEFCVRDAAVWGIRRQSLEEQYARLTDQELSRLEVTLQSNLDAREVDHEVVTLSIYILELEKLKRKLDSPQKALNNYQSRVQELQSELVLLKEEYDRVCREKKLYEDQIIESTKGPITEICEDIAKDYTRFRQFCSRVYETWRRWTAP
jgi:archaellum component FlaC